MGRLPVAMSASPRAPRAGRRSTIVCDPRVCNFCTDKKERDFVESERGRDAIRSGGRPKTPEEERDLEDAEEAAKRRARENDPEESRDYRKPS